jgi:carboxyl-terminal processing protease
MKNFILFIVGVFVGGILFSSVPGYTKGRYDKLRVYTQVFNLVEEHFVEKLQVERLVNASIRGLLGTLDPYSGYLTKKRYKKFKNETDGGFNGVGFELALKKRSLVVISIVEDSPAWLAGILPGDRIVKINGEVLKALDFAQATEAFAKAGRKKIELTIARVGEDNPLTFKVRKTKMKITPARKVLNENGVLVVRITSFSNNTADVLQDILEKETFDKLILDLRNNPGGLLNEAIDVVDFFVKKGKIVITKSRNPNDEINFANEEGTLYPKVPLFVLVDGASASASEIVASSLRDLGRAKILGIKTYGKGSVQSVIPLPEGQGGVKLTIARYFTASEKMIDKKGVAPDYKFPGKESISPTKDKSKDAGLLWALKKIKSL